MPFCARHAELHVGLDLRVRHDQRHGSKRPSAAARAAVRSAASALSSSSVRFE
jgi:hypothetical protein